MNFLLNLLVVLQVLSALLMVGFILVQHGKGADMGAAFGSGASGSLFGASGSANFLSRSTAALAAVFFACTLAITYFSNNLRASASHVSGSVLDQPAVVVPAAPRAASSAVAAIPAFVGAAASAAATASAPQPAASGAARIPQ